MFFLFVSWFVLFYLHKEIHFLYNIGDAEYISKATVCRAIRDMSLTLQINQHHPQQSSKDESFTFYLVSRRQICGHAPSANLGFRILVCLPGFFCLFFFFFLDKATRRLTLNHTVLPEVSRITLWHLIHSRFDSLRFIYFIVSCFQMRVSTAEPKREQFLDLVPFKQFLLAIFF